MKLVLLGDGESPHLLKWARALAPEVELWACSSRGFMAGFDELVPPARRLALGTAPQFQGGNVGLLGQLPRLARWLKQVRPDWIHAHYLTSHGTLAWLATRMLGAPGRIAGSAWGSDILVTPERGPLWRWVTRQVLAACAISTSDSQYMAWRMRALGAGEVMVFPFGLESLPAPTPPDSKFSHLFFANRGLEPIYAPERVMQVFAAIAAEWTDAELVVANTGSQQAGMKRLAAQAGLAHCVRFVGRLDAAEQARWYSRARWYLSLPRSDSVSVSVLEAMAYGCIPLLSDLPANHELVRSGDNGLVLPDAQVPGTAVLEPLAQRAQAIAEANHAWVAENAMFGPSVAEFLERLREIQAGRKRRVRMSTPQPAVVVEQPPATAPGP
ncbi:MAG: glycosyltransferase [Burkholderiaceae bacterium]|nr:glycosyltransferase [Burkholderiaceae bacterium]